MGFKRNKKSVNNCPICGVFVCIDYQHESRHNVEHECDPEFLKRSERATDATMERDDDANVGREKPFHERPSTGFEMLEEDDLADDEG